MSNENERIYKVRELASGDKVLSAPANAQGYWRRDVSKNGQTITYRRVA